MRSARGARIVPVVPVELFMVSVLLMPDPVVLREVELPEEVDGVVMVFASVERPVFEVAPLLGAVDIVPGLPDIVPDCVVAGALGLVVPLGDAVLAVGLAVDGPWLAVSELLAPGLPVLPVLWACARPTVRAAIAAAAVKVVEILRMVWLLCLTLSFGRLPCRGCDCGAHTQAMRKGNQRAARCRTRCRSAVG